MDNTEYLKQLAETEKKNKQIELEQAKAAALKSIGQQEATTMPTFTAQKKQASVQSQLGAKNLAEYWANRGQTNAGISAQAELSRGNVLGNTLQGIGQAEMAQQQAFNQARDTAGTKYQNQMTNFSNQVDQELATNLYQDKLAQQEAEAKAAQEAYERAWEQTKYANTLSQQDFENQLSLNKYNLSVYNANKDRQTKTPLTKQGNYENVTIPYTTSTTDRPIINNVRSGDKVIYNLANGSKLTFDLGTNPYTGSLNKDAVETQFNKNTGKYEKVLKTFANGYQPNNVGGKKLSDSQAKVQNPKNGEVVRVWTTGKVGDGKADHYYWDSTTNKYQKMSTGDKKVAGILKDRSAFGSGAGGGVSR